MINNIKKLIISNNLDGYLVPKNDQYFTEYSNISYLKQVSGFSGSAGFALILKNKNFLFVDGRYTLQAKKQSGKKFKSSNGIKKILNAPKVFIVAIDTPMSSFLDPKTLEELAIADEPQIPFPIPIKTDKFFETPKHLPIR